MFKFDLRHKVQGLLHERFGVSATYFSTNDATGTPVTVKLALSVETYDTQLNFVGDEDQITLLLSEIAQPKKKQRIIIDNITYYLTQRVKDDGVRQVWSVTSAR